MCGCECEVSNCMIWHTATDTLPVQTLEFDPAVFQPFLPRCIEELLRMLGEAETQEGKNRVAKALNTVIAQCKKNVRLGCSVFSKQSAECVTGGAIHQHDRPAYTAAVCVHHQAVGRRMC